MAITGNGQASKEQLAAILKQVLRIREESLLPYLDATDALGAAYCHFLQSGRDALRSDGPRTWADFVRRNGERVSAPTGPARKLMELTCRK